MVINRFTTEPIITFNNEALTWHAYYLSGLASELKVSRENDQWWFAFCVCLGPTRKAPVEEVLYHTELLQKAAREQVQKSLLLAEVIFRYERREVSYALPEYDPSAVVLGWQNALDRIHTLAPRFDPCVWSAPWNTQNVRKIEVPDDYYLRQPEYPKER